MAVLVVVEVGGMMPSVAMVGEVMSFPDVEIGDESSVALVVVMLVGAGMSVARMIVSMDWMGVDVAGGGGGSIAEEAMQMIEVGAGIIALALKGFEHGVIAEVGVGAVVGAGAEVGAGAGAEVVAGVEAGPAAVVLAPVAAAAAALKDIGGGVKVVLTKWSL